LRCDGSHRRTRQNGQEVSIVTRKMLCCHCCHYPWACARVEHLLCRCRVEDRMVSGGLLGFAAFSDFIRLPFALLCDGACTRHSYLHASFLLARAISTCTRHSYLHAPFLLTRAIPTCARHSYLHVLRGLAR
jgi:hypothetical protein